MRLQDILHEKFNYRPKNSLKAEGEFSLGKFLAYHEEIKTA
jgi:hypothetical protein